MALTKPYLNSNAYRIARTLYELSITSPGEYYTAAEIARLISSYYNNNPHHTRRLDARCIAHLIRHGAVGNYAVLDTCVRGGRSVEYRFVSGVCPELHAQPTTGGDAA